MSKRINVMIDEDTWTFPGRVPAGDRSRAIVAHATAASS